MHAVISPDPPGPDLVAEGIACRRGERVIFAGLSFRLGAGGGLILGGANGSGKSSLLRLIAGLLPAASGRLLWGGTPIVQDLPGHRARLHYLGHLDGIKGAMSSRETLGFWAALRGVKLRRGDPRLDLALAAFGLTGVAGWPCRWLSAGQRRRLALARLLVSPAPIWLLDEPTSALDAASQDRLEQAIAMHQENGGRVVVATHTPLAIAGAERLDLERFAASPDEAMA